MLRRLIAFSSLTIAPALGCGDSTSAPATETSEAGATSETSETSATATTSPTTTVGPSSSGDGDGDGDGDFEPIPCAPEPPDVLATRLCEGWDDPEGVADKINITCAMESACLAPPDPTPVLDLVVMTYNIERGLDLDEQLLAFADDPALPVPDVLLLIEADRGCSRTGGRNVVWEYAEALEMNFVYGVEYVELPREGGSGGTIEEPCEHGNAILSRFPIGNVELIRHAANISWYDTEEPRLGGRMAMTADIKVGPHLVRVTGLHFESGIGDGDIREQQAIELADHGLAFDGPIVIGGDTNAGTYSIDLLNGTMLNNTVGAFFDRGYEDTHASLPLEQRETRFPGLVIDLLFTRTPQTIVGAPGICDVSVCPYSDHAPVWTTLTLPNPS